MSSAEARKQLMRRAGFANMLGIIVLVLAVFAGGIRMWLLIAVAFGCFAMAVREQFRWRRSVLDDAGR